MNEFEQAYQETVTETQVAENPQGTETSETLAQEISPEQPQETQKFYIEGLGELTAEEIKEFKNGYMRQADYTRKTQEVARQRKELEQMQHIIPSQSPLAQRMQPQNDLETRIRQLEENIADRELDQMITSLKQKYPDFDEVQVLNTAYEKGIADLEFVYKSLRETQPVDMHSLKEQLRQEIMSEIQQNKGSTSTIIANGNAPVQNRQTNLSAQELAIANELGLTPEEYLEYK